MTDASPGVDAWVPRLGVLTEIDTERADLIRGLYELAAWVADHPDVPPPRVVARLVPRHSVFVDECAVVHEVAMELGTVPDLRAGGQHYVAEARFGPVVVSCAARTTEHMSADHLTDSAAPAAPAALVGGSR